MNYTLSVSEINKYIKEIIARDLVLGNLWVKGEISNYKYHSSGHMYFTLKDEKSLIKCIMFRTANSSLKFEPENGMKVIIRGYVSVFERDGQYQLYAEQMQPDGLGNLHLAFEQLKHRLYEEGLFDAAYKKKIPVLPKSIGVVTSSTGAVIRDIIHILSRRYSNFNLKIFPVAVQGELAARQISRAIRAFNSLNSVDVIIIARGGGSLEELWAFNEEIVARSIFESKIPIISAVGHETDYTIADFVADLRAPTPSAAAELVIPEKNMLQNTLLTYHTLLKNAVLRNLGLKKARYEKIRSSTVFRQPFDRVYQERMKLDIYNKSLQRGLLLHMERTRAQFSLMVGKLDALSPLTILARGYGIVKHKTEGNFIKSITDVENEDEMIVSVSDGDIYCKVEGIAGR